MVGLVAFAGCRVLSPQSSTSAPLSPPPISPEIQLPKIDESDRYEAFRPIIPGAVYVPPLPMREVPTMQEVPNIEPKPDLAAQLVIDELNRRVEELESQLEDAKNTPPPVNVVESLLLDEVPPTEKTEIKTPKNLPIINKQGVKVYTDELQHARIEVTDRSLFMPNSWQLTAEGEETLRVIAAEIRAYDSKTILDIEGHTDSLMGDPNNPMQKHEISSIKTKVVMDFFVNVLRWDASQIGTSSVGRSRPVADNGTPEGRARNNRIEIVIKDGNE